MLNKLLERAQGGNVMPSSWKNRVSTLLMIVGVFAAGFGVAAPSAADVYPGKQLEVYDANDELVGALISVAGNPVSSFFLSVALASGEAVLLSVAVHSDGGGSYWQTWCSPPSCNIDTADRFFESVDCTGDASFRSDSFSTAPFPFSSTPFLFGESGDHYEADAAGVLYRFSSSPSSITYNSRLYRNPEFCSPESGTDSLIEAPQVGTVSTAFPFYLKEVPNSAPFLPFWAFGTIAGGIVLSGGAIVVRRRMT